MAFRYQVLNRSDLHPKDFTEEFRMLDELYKRPVSGRVPGNGRAPPPPPPPSNLQYPYELCYQQPWMGFRNRVIYYPRESCVITSNEAAQIYGGAMLK
ncbi:hypothetical protein V6N13_022939 [Hibiscus sabdariffa]|uniref:Uncharacterized protein n=2 Tax=Hibiscus sabdariffa TaxID=183260 RepID=A0ABR2A8K5_9ROSI